MRAVIIGAGKTGVFLAERLRAEHEVTLVEMDVDLAEMLSAAMPSVTVVQGDGCEPAVLEFAGVPRADIVATMTGDDEDNLVASFLAKTEYQAPLVFARVNHPANEWLFTAEWGVDSAVSAASLVAALVAREADLGDVVTLLRLQAEGVTIEEVVLPPDSPVVGSKLSQIALPGEARVVAIISAHRVKVPRGDTELAAGDRLLLLGKLGETDSVHKALGVKPGHEQ
jgi:trk system potassium uptake protein